MPLIIQEASESITAQFVEPDFFIKMADKLQEIIYGA